MGGPFVENQRKIDRKKKWDKFRYHGKSTFAVTLSFIILIGCAVFVTKWVGDKWYDFRTAEDYIGEGTGEVVIDVPSGATLNQIGKILVDNGVVKSSKAFREAANKNPNATKIQQGRYRLPKEIPAAKAVEMLLDTANQVKIKITFPEGLNIKQQFAITTRTTGITQASIDAALKDPKAFGLPSYAGGNVEGFLFPDTYILDNDPTATEILKLQTARFEAIAEEVHLAKLASDHKVTPLQAVTIASIIERETRRDEDRPKVAAVIYNRLAAGMPLQMDSTVHYAIGKYDKVTTTDADRKTNSPYNTYLVKGLPPAPIANPGKASLQAALNPEQSNNLYFVTVDLDTGETKFATTEAEHKANVAQFQTWCSEHSGRC